VLKQCHPNIEGISRGSGESGVGTFLSVCLGMNNPISGTNPCHNSFPVRSFGIGSTSVASGGGVTTMTIVLSTSPPLGSIYPGELGMVKGSNQSTNNGTFKLQSVAGNTLTVTVPSTTGPCTGSCGTLFLGTPILGFGPPPGVAYGTASNACGSMGNQLCGSFGEHIKNLGFNCQGASGLDGCIGWQNLYAEEESGADTFIVDSYNFVGFDIHSFAAQNFGPVLNAEVYTGTGNTNCASGTTGAYIGDAQMRGLDSWTINQSAEAPNPPSQECPTTPITAVLLDAPNTDVRNGHCERTVNCVLIGANNKPNGTASGQRVSGVSGGDVCANAPGACNIVQISSNSPLHGKPVVERIQTNSYTNAVLDNLNNVTLTDAFMALYSYAGIRAGAISSGVSANTDLAGRCALSGVSGACTYQFTQTYNSTSPPICTCSDISAINACRVQVSGTPLTLTITGTSSDTVSYVCIGRN
jgi:hypothetical protein